MNKNSMLAVSAVILTVCFAAPLLAGFFYDTLVNHACVPNTPCAGEWTIYGDECRVDPTTGAVMGQCFFCEQSSLTTELCLKQENSTCYQGGLYYRSVTCGFKRNGTCAIDPAGGMQCVPATALGSTCKLPKCG